MTYNIAHAQEAATGATGAMGGALGSILPLILLVAIFYFLLIRPQQKRAKEHKAMVEALAVGDEVVAAGGIMGTVEEVRETDISLNLGETRARVQKYSVQAILPKGSLAGNAAGNKGGQKAA